MPGGSGYRKWSSENTMMAERQAVKIAAVVPQLAAAGQLVRNSTASPIVSGTTMSAPSDGHGAREARACSRRTAWYAAIWSKDLTSEPVGRTFLGEAVVLFRGANGQPAALDDRCCHRAAPLSLGAVEGDHLRCGYHGLIFDAKGQCVRCPGQDMVSSTRACAPIRSRNATTSCGSGWAIRRAPTTLRSSKCPGSPTRAGHYAQLPPHRGERAAPGRQSPRLHACRPSP